MTTFATLPSHLNLAALCLSTRVLGPGLRAAVWVQGCLLRCSNCIAPGWIPIRPASIIPVNFLVQKLIALPQLDGLTISGGEPMLQAAALSNLIQSVRKIRTMNVICFSGYTLAQLRTQPPSPEVEHLLTAIDVLVDGPYIDQANDDHGLRGSSNQQIHYLTPVLRDVDLSDHPRSVEMHLDNGEVLIVGVPPKKFSAAFDRFHTFPRAATPIGGS